MKGKAGINRALLTCTAPVTQSELEAALNAVALASVHELVATAGGETVAAAKSKDLPAIPPPPAGSGSAAAPDSPAGGDAEGAAPARLDLATLYTLHGLFRGSTRMPVPSNLDSQLYVPAGAAGIAMANLAARMGLETTGITLPLATPATSAAARDVRTKSVVETSSDLGKQAEQKFFEEDTVSRSEPALTQGQGELRIVDKAFGRHPAVLARGDEAGAQAALGLLAGHFPNVWETGKEHASLEEIRYDVHRFFSLRSAAGQASALYRLDRWADDARKSGAVRDVEAKVFIDIADPKLAALVRSRLAARLGVPDVKVEVSSLYAGTQCCETLPALHYQAPGYPYRQGTPAFHEDLVIPWEGTRLLDAVKTALPKLKSGEPVKLLARVSEGPGQRLGLKNQLEAMLAGAGAKSSQVQVLCAYKPGVSWLMDDIAPQLKGKPIRSLKIEFRKNTDPSGIRSMFSPARWVHELYPVDELLSKELGIPLEKISLAQFETTGKTPTYRVHAYDDAGKEMLAREFTVTTVEQPYNGVMPEYEKVEVDTGWVRMESGAAVVLDRRIPTDIEQFWQHYQKVTLPKVFRTIMASYHGELRPEFGPPFDTLKIDIHMSEPDYELGIDKERISSLEAVQEDTFYSTENFVNMMGDLMAGRALQYSGRIIPIVHPSEDGKDARVRIEFYAKPTGGPHVELQWTDAHGTRHERKRDLWALTGAMQPRLIAARIQAGVPGPESLTWLLKADYKDDDYAEWIKLEGKDRWSGESFPPSRPARNSPHSKKCMPRSFIRMNSPTLT